MTKMVLSMVVLLALAVSCDELEADEDQDVYPVGAMLRSSDSATDPCPPNTICKQWCVAFSDGTENSTELTCCVDPKYGDATMDPEAFAQCLNNLRGD